MDILELKSKHHKQAAPVSCVLSYYFREAP